MTDAVVDGAPSGAGDGPAFSKISLRVLALSGAVHVVQALQPDPIPGLNIIVSIACLVYLSGRATAYAKAGRSDFDAVIAAETIVAFGVLSLILGLASALAHVAFGGADVSASDTRALGWLALPFMEGLVTAGLAPFFAVVLRNRAFEQGEAVDAGDDMAVLARAARDLAKQLKASTDALASLRAAAEGASLSTRGLATNVEAETARLTAALGEGEGGVRAFGAAASSGKTEVAGLADETVRLKAAAGETTALLDELSTLIGQVERFVAPSTGRA